jgi:DNA-damage-inducible protein D
MNELKLFQSKQIRSVWDEAHGEWLFSIVDVVAALTDSTNPTDYLKKMRKRDNELKLYIGTNCPHVEMATETGKKRRTLAANTEQLFRIIQSIPSPKAEPFKIWLAQTGADHLNDLEAAAQLRKEVESRIQTRNSVREHNKSLADAAHNAGVETTEEYAKFQNSGYMGLYNGETAATIKRRKGLKKNQDILDHMGSTELAANLFRITQAEDKLRRENIKGKENANRIHFEVGATVRNTIKELGGTMPEHLPAPDKSIKQIEREQNKQLKKR